MSSLQPRCLTCPAQRRPRAGTGQRPARPSGIAAVSQRGHRGLGRALQSRAVHARPAPPPRSRIPDPHTVPAGGAERTGGRDFADSGVTPPRARRCSPAGGPSGRRGGVAAGAGSAGSATRGGGGTRTGAGDGPGLRPRAQRSPRAARRPIGGALAGGQSARRVLGGVVTVTARRHAGPAASAVSESGSGLKLQCYLN